MDADALREPIHLETERTETFCDDSGSNPETQHSIGVACFNAQSEGAIQNTENEPAKALTAEERERALLEVRERLASLKSGRGLEESIGRSVRMPSSNFGSL